MMIIIKKYWWIFVLMFLFFKNKNQSNKRIVKFGDNSEDVRSVQLWINDMCCFEKIDGIFGKNTSIDLMSVLDQLKFQYNINLSNTEVLKTHELGSYLGVYSVDLDWLNSLRKYGSIN